ARQWSCRIVSGTGRH
ncbi:gpH, partial [Escherichia coli 5412]